MKYGRRSKYIGLWCISNPLQCILLSAIVCVLWNEYLSFIFCRLMWPNLHVTSRDTDALRLLLVADPQITGLARPNAYSPYLNSPAIIDSDRYLTTGFTQAYTHIKPDVVVFLGDLFDEGSIAYLSEYINYYLRFQEIFKTDPGVKSVYIWGDNDVGGESFEPKIKEKMDRFEKTFEDLEKSPDKLWALDTVKGVDFIKIDQDFGVPLYSKEIEQLETLASASRGRYRILLNHMTLFYNVLADVHRIVQTLKADFIFSAHNHRSKIIRCKKCAKESLENRDLQIINDYPIYNDRLIPVPGVVYSFDLKNKSELVEITVPTCSYRNGESESAYGAAVLGGDGVLQYTILSLPSRQNHFIIYGFCLLLTVTIAVIKLCANCYRVNQ